MKKYFDQLTQSERRVVVIVALVTFIVLNVWLVWPHFSDLKRERDRMTSAQITIEMYRKELAHKREYEAAIAKFQTEGAEVQPEDQVIHFEREYRDRANQNGVIILSNSRALTHTNEFFLEQDVGLTIQAGEKQLVNYLFSLGSGDSMIRVQAMSLRPDPSHQQLSANITIKASYQKKAPAPRSTTPAKTVAAAAATKPGPPAVPGAKLTPVSNKPALPIVK